MKKKNLIIGSIVVAVVIVAAGVGLWMVREGQAPGGGTGAAGTPGGSTDTMNTVVFACDAGKSITATFDMTNDTQVQLALSDGRTLTLPHAVSADGARYANADESIVFWNVGNTATLQEGSTTTFANCAIAATAPTSSSSLVTYTNSKYGFMLQYPAALTPTSTFAHFYDLSGDWRVDAPQGQKGVNAIAIPVFRVDHGGVATGQPYPLYFDAEVRVGVSTDPQAVANCTATDPGYTSEPHRAVMLNGVQFEEFDIADQAMMQYVGAESYRVVHDNMCFVVEQVKAGSVYTDPTMKPGLTQAQLDAYYAAAGTIAQTFQFTK